MPTNVSRKTRVTLGVTLLAASAAGVLWLNHRCVPKRFGTVVEGRLYRSGEITPHELEYLAREYGLRTVLSLLKHSMPESIPERQTARRLGLRWVNVPLPGNGASTPAERDKIKSVLFDHDAAPLLVHCAAGVNRTGLAVGLYRIHQQGWTLADVLSEMREYDFEDLPRHQNLREALAAEWQLANRGREALLGFAEP